ncbi:chromosomal replication initiator protein DnaA [Haloferula sp. BvORR071]|uniref:chromosomal replication initiator protein DnaA n=1 Tax=Haloferula sp. BvORR071 TaxID=1396141 RepID=UPI000698967E|nr:chromosomal replication initiator protein DnaA [Haloferula sp. BvORR071]
MELEEEIEVAAEEGSITVVAQWEEVCEALGRLVSKDALQRWFGSSRLVAVEDSRAVVAVPNEIHLVWIETNYMPELASAVTESIEGVLGVKLVVEDDLPAVKEASPAGDDADLAIEAAPAASSPVGGDVSFEKRLKAAGLNHNYTFESFVVGANSQFAQAACEAVAKRKGPGYNPLFIHGGSGLGKTHLMQAIGHHWLKGVPASRVVYLTCEKFTNEFIDAVRKGDLERFRKRYRNAELMLLDDVQFLGGKERSQEEFFHTFNTLLDGRCQVVLTSDKPASEIKNLEPRLISRFECGLTVELQPPVFETRLAILGKKRDEWKVKVDEGIIRFLAERIKSNVRRLEGALMRVATYASLAGERVTEERVEHLLRDLLREEAGKQITIDTIQRAVADHFDIRLADMTSKRRPASIAYPRQIAMYLSRTMTKNSLMEIGEAFGGRDHGTVIHACKKIQGHLETDSSARDAIGVIESGLKR